MPKPVNSPADYAISLEEATWMIMMPSPVYLNKKEVSSKVDSMTAINPKTAVWSDDSASLRQALK